MSNILKFFAQAYFQRVYFFFFFCDVWSGGISHNLGNLAWCVLFLSFLFSLSSLLLFCTAGWLLTGSEVGVLRVREAFGCCCYPCSSSTYRVICVTLVAEWTMANDVVVHPCQFRVHLCSFARALVTMQCACREGGVVCCRMLWVVWRLQT